MNQFPYLETERLTLCEVKNSDAEDLFAILSDEDVMRYYGDLPFESLQQVRHAINWYRNSLHDETGIRLGIFPKHGFRLIGTCGFHTILQDHGRADMVCLLARDQWGQGYMQEALQKLIQYGFEQLGLHRLQALIEPPNTPSLRLFERLGFEREGVLRDYYRQSGSYTDMVMMSLLNRSSRS